MNHNFQLLDRVRVRPKDAPYGGKTGHIILMHRLFATWYLVHFPDGNNYWVSEDHMEHAGEA